MEENWIKHLPAPGVYDKDELSLTDLLSRLSSIYEAGQVGALALFMGVARAEGRLGRKVRSLEIEAYEENANFELKKICREVAERHGVSFVGVWHLQGKFRPGEPVVLVVVSGGHRAEVMDALQEAVERYKREPALFKKEVYEDGGHEWVLG